MPSHSVSTSIDRDSDIDLTEIPSGRYARIVSASTNKDYIGSIVFRPANCGDVVLLSGGGSWPSGAGHLRGAYRVTLLPAGTEIKIVVG